MEEGSEVLGQGDLNEAQGIMQDMTDHSSCNEMTLSQHKGVRRVASVLDKQLSTVEWIDWWCQRFSPSSLKECECLREFARPAWGERIGGGAQPNIRV